MKTTKKMFTRCLILGLIALGLSPSSELQAAPATTELEGRWAQPCANGSVRTEFFQGTKVSLNEMFFKDKDCRQPVMVFINDGTFIQPQAGQIDFKFSSVRMRLITELAATEFNHRAVCGFSDWKALQEKEISGRSCEIFVIGFPQRIPTAGDMRYGIYHIDQSQGRLYFGKLSKEKNAATPEARPQDLDPRYYQKVPHLSPPKNN